jgi:hypothetical protein
VSTDVSTDVSEGLLTFVLGLASATQGVAGVCFSRFYVSKRYSQLTLVTCFPQTLTDCSANCASQAWWPTVL